MFLDRMFKNPWMPGSVYHRRTLDRAWGMGKYACPECGCLLPIAQQTPLMMNECAHCHQMFYMPRKLASYYLYEIAGGGGMGTVYRAVSEKFPDQILAVKLLTRAAAENPGNIRALLNECRISAKFRDSEFIVSCLDSGFTEGEYFMVMPFTRGERLDKRIERLHHLPPKEVLTISRHLLAAEQHICSKGYLFRDMKPENVILAEDGYAKLLDFGLCVSLREAAAPHDEYISGSPYYMPPERLQGQPEGPRSEIYSLAMVMFHALTGHPLYDADGLNELAHQHVATIRISNSAKMMGLPPPIAALLGEMMQQQPERRPQHFAEVDARIQEILKAGV